MATFQGDALTVEDAQGVQRVVIGKIASNPDDYGLVVQNPGGGTTIIDGTSDMFKIAATGTQTVSVPGTSASQGQASTVISAAGTFSVVPAFLYSQTDDNSSGANERGPGYYLALVAGNPVTIQQAYRSYAILTGSPPSTITVLLGYLNATNAFNTASTAAQRWYLLIEAGI